MIVTLDGRRMEADFTSADTLQALIDRVRAEHLPDRLVVSVTVNGQLLLPEVLPYGILVSAIRIMPSSAGPLLREMPEPIMSLLNLRRPIPVHRRKPILKQ